MSNPKLMYPLAGILVVALGAMLYLLFGQKPPERGPAARATATQAAPGARTGVPGGAGQAEQGQAAAAGGTTGRAGTEVAQALPRFVPWPGGRHNPFAAPAPPEAPKPEKAAPPAPAPGPEKLAPPSVPPVTPVQVGLPPGAQVFPPVVEPGFNWQQFAFQGARRRPYEETRPLSVTGTVVGSDGKAAAVLTDGSQRFVVRSGQRISVGGRALEVLSIDHGGVVLQEGQRRISLGIGGASR